MFVDVAGACGCENVAGVLFQIWAPSGSSCCLFAAVLLLYSHGI